MNEDKAKRKYKAPYTAAFKQQMVELVASGRRVSELAREFDCHETSILSWVRQAQAGVVNSAPVKQAAPLSVDERAELLELRRKLRQVQQERDILAKATAWFAGKSEPTCTPSMR